MSTALFINSIWETIATNLSRWNAILGIALAVLALTLVFVSTPIILKSKIADEKKGKAILICKVAGMLLAVVGALVACLT